MFSKSSLETLRTRATALAASAQNAVADVSSVLRVSPGLLMCVWVGPLLNTLSPILFCPVPSLAE
jgi:hypothetical protein